MKFVKGISLFLIYPLIMFCLGMYTGIVLEDFFYPGRQQYPSQEIVFPSSDTETDVPPTGSLPEVASTEKDEEPEEIFRETSKKEDVITADTEYVLEEVDIKKETSVRTIWKVPIKYIGMSRESFLKAMDEYELSPPLSEQERGFVGLEVLSFSTQQVVVRMNYAYVEPSHSFYLGVRNNYVIVYLDDKETVYIETDILLEDLPGQMQQQIIQYMFIEGEGELYNFLESYSS